MGLWQERSATEYALKLFIVPNPLDVPVGLFRTKNNVKIEPWRLKGQVNDMNGSCEVNHVDGVEMSEPFGSRCMRILATVAFQGLGFRGYRSR